MAAMGSLPRLHAIILWVALITSARALVSMDTESMTEAEQKWGFDVSKPLIDIRPTWLIEVSGGTPASLHSDTSLTESV